MIARQLQNLILVDQPRFRAISKKVTTVNRRLLLHPFSAHRLSLHYAELSIVPKAPIYRMHIYDRISCKFLMCLFLKSRDMPPLEVKRVKQRSFEPIKYIDLWVLLEG